MAYSRICQLISRNPKGFANDAQISSLPTSRAHYHVTELEKLDITSMDKAPK